MGGDQWRPGTLQAVMFAKAVKDGEAQYVELLDNGLRLMRAHEKGFALWFEGEGWPDPERAREVWQEVSECRRLPMPKETSDWESRHYVQYLLDSLREVF